MFNTVKKTNKHKRDKHEIILVGKKSHLETVTNVGSIFFGFG